MNPTDEATSRARPAPEATSRARPAPEATSRVLVAGVGNIFLSDDGFGVEVVGRLAGESFPAGVKVADFGIRGVHLAYELLEGYDTLVLVDAVSRGDTPGTVSVIEHSPGDSFGGDGVLAAMDAHGMDPAAVLAMVDDMGGHVGRVLVVGCEVGRVDEGIGLSCEVAGAVPSAAMAVHEVIASIAAGRPGVAADVQNDNAPSAARDEKECLQ